jgi:hypothetical protein
MYYYIQLIKEMADYKRECNFCQKNFIAQKYNTKTCSNRCENLSQMLKVRQDKQNLFDDNETYKRLLNKILLSVERIEMVLDLQGIKEQIANQDLLTTEQYSEYMNIHPRTVRRMIDRKEIEVTKHNNQMQVQLISATGYYLVGTSLRLRLHFVPCHRAKGEYICMKIKDISYTLFGILP